LLASSSSYSNHLALIILELLQPSSFNHPRAIPIILF
jgi:hypothetical protein